MAAPGPPQRAGAGPSVVTDNTDPAGNETRRLAGRRRGWCILAMHEFEWPSWLQEAAAQISFVDEAFNAEYLVRVQTFRDPLNIAQHFTRTNVPYIIAALRGGAGGHA